MPTIGQRVRVTSTGATGTIIDVYRFPTGKIDVRLELDASVPCWFGPSLDAFVDASDVVPLVTN